MNRAKDLFKDKCAGICPLCNKMVVCDMEKVARPHSKHSVILEMPYEECEGSGKVVPNASKVIIRDLTIEDDFMTDEPKQCTVCCGFVEKDELYFKDELGLIVCAHCSPKVIPSDWLPFYNIKELKKNA